MQSETESGGEQPEADYAEIKAIVERFRQAAEPNAEGCDREDLWSIARELKSLKDQLAKQHSSRETLTVAEVRSALDKASLDAPVVLHVGGSITFGVVAVYPDAHATPTGRRSGRVVILSSSDEGTLK